MGGGKDPGTYTSINLPDRLHEYQLSWLYEGSWICQRLIDLPPGEMSRSWIELDIRDGDTDDVDAVLRSLKRLKVRQRFKDAYRWARLFGGAAIVIGVNDGQLPDQPVVTERIKSIDYLEVLDRYQLHADVRTVGSDSSNPEFYQLNLGYGRDRLTDSRGKEIVYGTPIHKSRILRFDGEALPRLERVNNQGWGLSSLQRFYYAFKNYFEGNAHLLAGLKSFSVFVHSVNNLSDLIAADQGELVKQHFQEVVLMLSTFNALLTDGSIENSQFASRNFAGVSDAIQQIRDELTAASGMPNYLLWGSIGKAGLSDDGRAEKEAWADSVNELQEDHFREPYEQLIPYVMQTALGSVPEVWDLNFPRLFGLDPKTQAEILKLNTESYEMLKGMGSVLPEEIREAVATGSGLEAAIDLSVDIEAINQEKAAAAMEMQQSLTTESEEETAKETKADSVTTEVFTDPAMGDAELDAIAFSVFDQQVVDAAARDWGDRSPIELL